MTFLLIRTRTVSQFTGELGKYRSNTNAVTHISSSDIAEAGWGDEARGQGKSGDLMLINMKVALSPGHNKITVEGKVRKGEGGEGRVGGGRGRKGKGGGRVKGGERRRKGGGGGGWRRGGWGWLEGSGKRRE